MNVKMKFCILAMFVLTVAAVWFETGEAGAFTISDDGEYALVLNLKVSDADATIDGQQSGKVIKFNFDEDEEAIRVSDLTQGICPYNGKNEFSGWAGDSASSETVEMLSKDEFSSTGSMNGVSYTKGHSIYALFLGAEIEQPQQYYVLFNAVDGEVLTDGVSTGEDKVVLSGTMDQLTSQDLSKYTAQREGCTFCGWGFNSEISNGQFFTSTSLTPSELEKYSPMTIFALYKKNTFEGNYLVLALDANGGTIDGQDVEKCDYLSDSSKSSAMPIFQYVPKRRGYKFTGWHAETVVLLSHKKPDGHINVKVEFGEGEGKVPLDNIAKRAEEYKPKERVTYKMIKEYIEAKYGFKVHTAYIAEVKRDLGLPMYDAPNAVEELKQPRKHPTAEKVEAIKDALKHFEVI